MIIKNQQYDWKICALFRHTHTGLLLLCYSSTTKKFPQQECLNNSFNSAVPPHQSSNSASTKILHLEAKCERRFSVPIQIKQIHIPAASKYSKSINIFVAFKSVPSSCKPMQEIGLLRSQDSSLGVNLNWKRHEGTVLTCESDKHKPLVLMHQFYLS